MVCSVPWLSRTSAWFGSVEIPGDLSVGGLFDIIFEEVRGFAGQVDDHVGFVLVSLAQVGRRQEGRSLNSKNKQQGVCQPYIACNKV